MDLGVMTMNEYSTLPRSPEQALHHQMQFRVTSRTQWDLTPLQRDTINVFILRFGLVSLFNGISTLFRLFNAKAILLEEQKWYYLTHSWEDKGVRTFPKGICPKVNVIARTTILQSIALTITPRGPPPPRIYSNPSRMISCCC